MLRFSVKFFTVSVLLFVLLVIIALFVHDQFIRPFLGDVLVVIWLFYGLKSFLELADFWLSIAVLLFCFAVEFAQYLQLIHWLGWEHITVIRVVLGATFDWKDMAAYCLGWLMALLISAISSGSFKRSVTKSGCLK